MPGAHRCVGLMIASLALCMSDPVAAESYIATANNYRTHLKQLQPGDTLVLAPGLYREGLPLHGLEGKPGQPIIIEGDASGVGTVFVARPGANTVSIKNAAHLVVRSLVLDGAGLPVDAIKAEGTSKFAHHITLENLTIANHGIDQQVIGISTKCPAWGWIIRDNVIRGAGTGMYLGNSDGSAPFVGGLIEGNLIVDTVGYNLQIKHQRARPAIMPNESMQTVIRGNVFSKANGGSVGKLARPNVLLGHFPLSGAGMEDEYRVYGNFFHDNPHESLLQAEGNVSLHDNIVVNSHGDAVRIQPHHAEPRRVLLSHNTIVARGIGIGVGGGNIQFRQAVVANAVFAGTPVQGGEQRWNVTGPYEAAGEMLVAPFARLGELDFSPRIEQIVSASPHANKEPLTGGRDFYGRCRDVSVVGAVLVRGRTTPWRLNLTRRPWDASWDEPCRGPSAKGLAEPQ
jgi:hypothetical protein